jgi:hypothetical protein
MRRTIITSFTLLLFLPVIFWSCEKGLDNVQYESTIYFPQSGFNDVSLLQGESTYDLAVYRAGINQSQKNLDVEVVYDQAGGEAFINDSNNYTLTFLGFPILFKDIPEADRYKLLPEGFYTLPQGTVSIKGDEVRGFYSINFKNITDALSGTKYILPLKIVGTNPEATLLAEKSSVILHLSNPRNVWAGLYKSMGEVTTSGTSDVLKIDTECEALTIDENTISIPGPIIGMKVYVSINNNQVTVTSGVGSEAYNIQDISGQPSTYEGAFNETYQRNKGNFKLYYTYEIVTGGVTTVFTVEEELKFWL